MQRGLWPGELMQDLRISLRGLFRAPLMSMTIVATVGLGIGATTVIFAAVNAALLQPLPYADPARLVRIYTDAPPNKFRFSVADYLALQAQQTQFEQVAGYTDRAMAFSDGNVAERLRGRVVSSTYFALLGIRPAIGRDFTQQDGSPGSPPAVIVSHGFWQRRLGGRLDVAGTFVRLDGADYALAGVLPPSTGPLEQRQEFFVAAQWDTPRRKGPFFITVLGRLRHESARSAATGELRAINRRIFPLWRSSYQDEKASWSLMDLKTHVTGDVGMIAGLALTAVGLVWLIACTNASSLLIARVTSRRRELAVRAALGASRGRVVRHLLAESALLAIGAAGLGFVLAWMGIGLLRDFGADYFPRTDEISLDGPVLWLLSGLTAASALLFGLVPSVHGSGGPVDESLRSMGRSSTGSVAVRRLRQALVGTQFAIATPLLVVAGLLLVSLDALGRVNLGFDTHNLLSGSISLPAVEYAEPGRVATFWNELQRRVEALPVVSGVTFADGRPPDDVGNFNNFDLEASPTAAGTIATGHAVGVRDAGVLRSSRTLASRRTSLRPARRPRLQRRSRGRRSSLGETVLSERECRRQTVPRRRLHDLSLDHGGRRRERRQVCGPGCARRGSCLHANGGARGIVSHRGGDDAVPISDTANPHRSQRRAACGQANRPRARPEPAIFQRRDD